jgi:hypothetical protein
MKSHGALCKLITLSAILRLALHYLIKIKQRFYRGRYTNRLISLIDFVYLKITTDFLDWWKFNT